jgi:hypothetical protein
MFPKENAWNPKDLDMVAGLSSHSCMIRDSYMHRATVLPRSAACTAHERCPYLKTALQFLVWWLQGSGLHS